MMAAAVVGGFVFMRFPNAKGWFFRKPYIAVGIILAAAAAMYLSESSTAYSWKRLATSNGKASAEFPADPVTETATEVSEGISVKRTTLRCSVPHKDISLHLSWSDIPPEGSTLTAAQRLEGMKASLEEQGFVISSCLAEDRGAIRYYRIVGDKDGGNLRFRTRIAFTSKAIYRTVAASSSGFHDDPAIAHFIDSFSVE
ncbi:MAG: hypothetical protein NTV86_21060 [Planctomycetota bacterium]|nr:hypothetical protein [Planctomycetota bacterium]